MKSLSFYRVDLAPISFVFLTLLGFRSASSRDSGSGTIWLCFMNVVLFVLGNVFNLRAIQSLYFLHASPRWWQFITSAFCHANFEHLSSNLFLLYVFGKLVEEQEGAFGVWMTYLICAIGSNLVSLWKYPANAVSLGASAAVFGLFVVSVLIRLSWNWKNILEVGILGQFVVTHIIHEVNAQLQGGTSSSMGTVGHLSHLAGALMGVLLIVLLKQLPDPDGNGKRSS